MKTFLIFLLFFVPFVCAEKFAGPDISRPIMFNTPEADKIMSNLQIFPKDNPWNEDITGKPVHKNSSLMIDSCGSGKKLAYNLDMCYIIVPPDQKKINVKLVDYSDESDSGPYPVPDNATIEGYPIGTSTLDDIQRNGKGDRHCLILDPVNMKIYEFWQTRKTNDGWQASNEATFDLTTNKTRPIGWTSSDAAGLPIIPATIRYDEVAKGIVSHAMRITFVKTRKDFVYPATHYASKLTDDKYPSMGERLRLKKSVTLDGFSPHPRAILLGMQKYGVFVADNGGDWRISVCPDSRLKNLDELGKIKGNDFEFIEPTTIQTIIQDTAPAPMISAPAVFGRIGVKNTIDGKTSILIKMNDGSRKEIYFSETNFIRDGKKVEDEKLVATGNDAAIVKENGKETIYIGIDAVKIFKQQVKK